MKILAAFVLGLVMALVMIAFVLHVALTAVFG